MRLKNFKIAKKVFDSKNNRLTSAQSSPKFLRGNNSKREELNNP